MRRVLDASRASKLDQTVMSQTLPAEGTIIRVSAWRRQVLWALACLPIIFAVCVLVFAIKSGQPAASLIIAVYGLFAFVLARGALGGIVLSENGIKARSTWRTYRWRWNEIEKCELRKKGETPRFRVHLVNGRVHGYLGFYARTQEDEERGQELFAALEERLARERARSAPTLMGDPSSYRHEVPEDSELEFGFWQGAHWHRICRIFPAAFSLLVLFSSWSNNAPSVSQVLVTLGCISFVFLIVEWAFVRKTGFEICSDGLILCGPIRRVRVPWSQVKGFIWQERRSRSRGKFLCLETDQEIPRRFPRNAPVRVPTVTCVFDSQLPNDRLLGPLLTSSRVRSADGREVEAVELLERVRSRALAMTRQGLGAERVQ